MQTNKIGCTNFYEQKYVFYIYMFHFFVHPFLFVAHKWTLIVIHIYFDFFLKP